MSEFVDPALRPRIVAALVRARARTATLTESVDDGDLVAQHSRLMSPLVWDLAHIGNQEEMWLLRAAAGREPIRADLDELYNALRHTRADRPALPLLGPAHARGYVDTVRDRVWDTLGRNDVDAGARELTRSGFVFGMIAQHEQQHDETMLATHQLRDGPAVLHAPDAPRATAAVDGEAMISAGEFIMGTSAEAWALDNERPAHVVTLPAFAIDVAPVTNEQYRDFIDDGGYERPQLWSEHGWAHRCRSGLHAPQFWERDRHRNGMWWRRRFGTMVPVRPRQPVMHVSWHEVQAYARWAGKRLPTEAEWEKAARFDPTTGTTRRSPWGNSDPDETTANIGQRHLEPADVGAYPAGVSPTGVAALIGDVWEWTASEFRPYPGFRAFPYREYSQVFFGGDYRVLRGGSFGTDPVACRATFRNWDHPVRRHIFAGFRLARDV